MGFLSGLFGGGSGPQINNKIDPNAFIDPNSAQTREQLQQALLAQSGQNVQNDPARQQQMALAQMLQQRAMGTGGPSAAELQMQAGSDEAIRQQMGAMASNRAANPGMAMRLAGEQGAGMQQQNVQDMGILRAQEQMGAQGALGNLLAGTRQGDLGANSLQGDMMKYYQQSLIDQAEKNRQALMMQQQLASAQAQEQAKIQQQNQASKNSMFGNILGAAGTLGMLAATGGAAAPLMGAMGGIMKGAGGGGGLTMPNMSSADLMALWGK